MEIKMEIKDVIKLILELLSNDIKVYITEEGSKLIEGGI